MGRFREDCDDDLYYLQSLVCDLNFPSPLTAHYKSFLGMAKDSLNDLIETKIEDISEDIKNKMSLLVALTAKSLMNNEDISTNATIILLKNQLSNGDRGAIYLAQEAAENEP